MVMALAAQLGIVGLALPTLLAVVLGLKEFFVFFSC